MPTLLNLAILSFKPSAEYVYVSSFPEIILPLKSVIVFALGGKEREEKDKDQQHR